MTTETLTLNPIAALAALIPSNSAVLCFAEAPASDPLELAARKPSYGYDDESSEEDDGYNDEDDEFEDDDEEDEEGDEEEEEGDEEEDDDYAYDDEDEDEEEEEEDDEEDEDEDEEDDDIGYYTRSSGPAL